MNPCATCGKLTKNIKFCNRECLNTNLEYNLSKGKKKEKDIVSDKVVECNICNKQFNDVNNISGALTRHSKIHDLVFSINNFTIKDKILDNKSYWSCPICDWKTFDIDNKSGCIANHIKLKHDFNIQQFIEKYPIESENIFKHKKKLLNRDTELLVDENRVQCKICNEYLKTISNTHLIKHNITVEEYKNKFNTNIVSQKTSNKLSSNTTKFNKELYEKYKLNNIEFPIHSKE